MTRENRPHIGQRRRDLNASETPNADIPNARYPDVGVAPDADKAKKQPTRTDPN